MFPPQYFLVNVSYQHVMANRPFLYTVIPEFCVLINGVFLCSCGSVGNFGFVNPKVVGSNPCCCLLV